MEKEEILAKSRAENKNRDVCDVETQRKGAALGNAAMIFIAVVFHYTEYSMTRQWNHGFFALACISLAVTFWYKWMQLKRKHEFWTALIYSVSAVGFTAAYILGLLRR